VVFAIVMAKFRHAHCDVFVVGCTMAGVRELVKVSFLRLIGPGVSASDLKGSCCFICTRT
jgi:hypothetical protein